MQIHHLNCVKIVSPLSDNVCGHCILIDSGNKLILIDTGIGLLDCTNPLERIGQELISLVGYEFDENLTAAKQVLNLGLDPGDVTDCIISHLDNDHIGGLADFPNAAVHLAFEEMENYNNGNVRYIKTPLSHNPKIITYKETTTRWFGFEARKVAIDLEFDIFLIPLFGHTLGHCGIAINTGDSWLFYVADAYYLRIELADDKHPVNDLAKFRADDNVLRIKTVNQIRNFSHNHPEVKLFGYHDIDEFDAFLN